MIGTDLLNYRVVRELGAGGLGSVYEGEHKIIGRRAALKVLHAAVSHDSGMVARFLAEARSVNAIRHPNIVDVTDYGESEGRFIIVMELLEGETVAQRAERLRALDEATVVSLLSQTAAAVGAAHEQGIVHRDLKPENLFFTQHPDYPDFVKVLDFGIAKLLGTASQGTKTSPGLIIGTPAWMSPEQCLGDEQLDHRSDIYSLGVVAYRLLTGRVPYEGNAMQMMHGHLSGTFRPLELEGVSERLSQVITRCLQRQADARYQSMRELRGELLALTEVGAPSKRRVPEPPPPATVSTKTAQLPPQLGAAERAQAMALSIKLKGIISRKLANDTLKLPSLPEVAVKALELAHNPDVRFATIAAQLERDPFISTRLLRVANSPLFGGLSRCTTMEGAIARLGVKQLVVLLQELAAEQVFSSRDPMIRNAFRGIWEHCLGVAHLARDLAREVGSLEPSTAYLGGLFHDIGKPVVAAMLLEVERGSTHFISGAVWQRVVEECHREVGAIIAYRWFLPREVSAAIAELESYDVRQGKRSCANVVKLSNALCQREGLDIRAHDPEAVARSIVQGRQLLQLTDAQLDRATSTIVSRVQALTQPNTSEGESSTRVFDRTAG